jgi:transposase
MKSYSLDLRQRIVAAVEGGMAKTVAAQTFGVSYATVKRYVHREAVGDLPPRTSTGRRRAIDAPAEPALRAQLAVTPDATLAEHVEQWAAEHGGVVSEITMLRSIDRLGWTRKTRPSSPPSATR